MQNLSLLKRIAWNNFPCQELWYKDNSFWSFEKGDNNVYLTSGYLEDENLSFHTIKLFASDVESFIDMLCDSKRRDGYECFASELIT
jgi:hypothetical protein